MAQNSVTAYSLNVREGAGTEFRVLGFLRQNEIVDVLEVITAGTWKKVRSAAGLTGWCSARYLANFSTDPTPPPSEIALGKHRVYNASALNLREGPGLTQRVLGALNAEQVVEVQEISADKQWKRLTTARGERGWSALRYLAPIGVMSEPREPEEFPWMPIAFGELGVREAAGSARNPRLIEYLMSTTLPSANLLQDETDWCAAFVAWCMDQAKIENVHAALVSPWMRWGQPLPVPRRGCLAIFRWEDGGSHVTFYLGEVGAQIIALGGNQSDAVWISSYPRARAIGFRVPAGWKV
jgi:uncharacterized protein (TIGR02594 family)